MGSKKYVLFTLNMPTKFASGVYSIKNLVSGKVYIGSARLFKRRFSQHKTCLRGGYHQNSHLQRAWKKYGEDAFEFSIVVICNPELMQFYEQRMIDSMAPEYNQSKSAYSGIPVGSTITEQHKSKVATASKAAWQRSDYRQKVTDSIRKAMTDEECANRSERTKLLWQNPEYREKAISARKGRATNKGYKCSPEQVANRKKAARISNMKRNYGEDWQNEYARRYPEFVGDLNAI